MTSDFAINTRVQAHKNLLRYFIRKVRKKNIDAGFRHSAAFASHLLKLVEQKQKHPGQGLLIAAFLPLDSEPPITEALTALARAGHRVVVPVVLPQRQLAWVCWTPESGYTTNSMGIREPQGQRFGSELFLSADIRLVPALAYSLSGQRLGQGGGFYDTLLAKLDLETEKNLSTEQSKNFGVVFAREILDGLPAADWDAKIYHLVTEEGSRHLEQT